jgi:hypothetical protein
MSEINKKISIMASRIEAKLGFKPGNCSKCVHRRRCTDRVTAGLSVVCELSDEDAEIPLLNRASKHANTEDEMEWFEAEYKLWLPIKNNLW